MRWPSRRQLIRRNEQGVFLVLYALMFVAIFVMVAIVIDLGAVRTERRKSRNAADAAATAGALDLDVSRPQACKTAVTYAFRNLGLTPPTSPCGTFPATACTLATGPTNWTEPAGDFTITVKQPVPDIDPLMKADTPGGDIDQTISSMTDGQQCDRIGVEIRYTRQTIFSKVIGITQNTTTVHSVARKRTEVGDQTEIASLVVLEPSDCSALDAGTGTIQALGSSATHPGIIRTDTTATGCAPGFAMEVQGSGRIKACAFGQSPAGTCTGTIGHFATVSRAYDPGDFTNFNGNLEKQTKPLTRAPVDAVYHCSNVPVTGCPLVSGVPKTDYINDATAKYQTTVPTPFTIIPSSSCSPSGTVTYATGTYFVDCTTYTVKGATVTFEGGTVVFNGGISLQSNGNLNINTVGSLPANGSKDAILYLRASTGNISKQSNTANLKMLQTFVFSHGGIDLNSGGLVTWTAPKAGNFKDLLYWTESTTASTFSGGPAFSSDGVWFQGNALLDVQGSGTLDATNVQFWTDKIRTQGAAIVTLQANPDRAIATERTVSQLIR